MNLYLSPVKVDAARLLDEDQDLHYFDYDGQNDDLVLLPTSDDDRTNLRDGLCELGGDAEANQQTTKAESAVEWSQAGTNENKDDGDAAAVRVFTVASSHFNNRL